MPHLATTKRAASKPLLIGLTLSPWSLKARWALNWHEIAYDWEEFLPMMSTPALRWRLKQWRGPVTVPVLIAPDRIVKESEDIVVYADQVGSGEPLIPAADRQSILDWNRDMDSACEAGRALLTHRLLQNPKAQQALLPEFVPQPLRPAMKFLAKQTGHYFTRKYDLDWRLLDEYRHRVEQALARIRTQLESARAEGHNFLMGPTFTLVDISSMAFLQMVKPMQTEAVPMAPEVEEIWIEPGLCDEYTDVLAWRDEMFPRYWSGAPQVMSAA